MKRNRANLTVLVQLSDGTGFDALITNLSSILFFEIFWQTFKGLGIDTIDGMARRKFGLKGLFGAYTFEDLGDWVPEKITRIPLPGPARAANQLELEIALKAPAFDLTKEYLVRGQEQCHHRNRLPELHDDVACRRH